MMGIMQYGLIFAGLSSIALGLLHLPPVWGSVFTQWSAEINSISQLSRKLVNTVLVALSLALMILGSATLLLIEKTSAYGAFRAWFFFFCFIFWVWRLGWQILYFPYRKLNPSRQLLFLHVVLIIIFLANAFAYLAPVMKSVRTLS